MGYGHRVTTEVGHTVWQCSDPNMKPRHTDSEVVLETIRLTSSDQVAACRVCRSFEQTSRCVMVAHDWVTDAMRSLDRIRSDKWSLLGLLGLSHCASYSHLTGSITLIAAHRVGKQDLYEP